MFEPRRVQLIDDERDLTVGLTLRLRRERYEVRSNLDGASGLAEAARFRPHAIVLDLRMPGMSGFEVLAALAADPALRVIPVVVLSANVAERSQDRAYALGARYFLSKPFASSELIGRLAEITAETPAAG